MDLISFYTLPETHSSPPYPLPSTLLPLENSPLTARPSATLDSNIPSPHTRLCVPQHFFSWIFGARLENDGRWDPGIMNGLDFTLPGTCTVFVLALALAFGHYIS